MIPIGKKYLIKIDRAPKEKFVGNIYIPNLDADSQLIHYIGKIVGYGSGFTESEVKDLIPINTTVIMDYNKNENMQHRVRLEWDSDTFYVYPPEDILAILEEE